MNNDYVSDAVLDYGYTDMNIKDILITFDHSLNLYVMPRGSYWGRNEGKTSLFTIKIL